MHLRALERMLEEQWERDRRYGVADDEYDEFERELELADRIAEHASVPPGDPRCRALARKRLGLPGSPYEQPHDRPLHRYAEGDRVRHHHVTGRGRAGSCACSITKASSRSTSAARARPSSASTRSSPRPPDGDRATGAPRSRRHLHRVTLTREQRDWINATATALEDHADHDEDPPAMLEAASELRRVVRDCDVARDTRPGDAREPRLRDASAPDRRRRVGDLGLDRAGRARRSPGDEQWRRRRAPRRRDGDSPRRDRRPPSGPRRQADDPRTRARRAAQHVRAGHHQRPAAALCPLPARAARRGRTPRPARSRAPRAPGARLARRPAQLSKPRPGSATAPDTSRQQGERCTNRSGSARPAPTPRGHPPRTGWRGRPPTASRSLGRRRDRRRPPAAALLPALEAGARPPALGRARAPRATNPSTPTTRTRGPAATSTPTRSCAATASPASRPPA